MALIGNTVKLKAEFINYDGKQLDVHDVTLTIYDERKRVVLTVPEANLSKNGTGNFSYDYLVPEGATPYYYEFSGIYNGLRYSGRKPLLREWIKEEV